MSSTALSQSPAANLELSALWMSSLDISWKFNSASRLDMSSTCWCHQHGRLANSRLVQWPTLAASFSSSFSFRACFVESGLKMVSHESAVGARVWETVSSEFGHICGGSSPRTLVPASDDLLR